MKIEYFLFQQMNNKKFSAWNWCNRRTLQLPRERKERDGRWKRASEWAADGSREKNNDDDDDEDDGTIFNEIWHWVLLNYKCSSCIALFSLCIWSNVNVNCELRIANYKLRIANAYSVRPIREVNKLQSWLRETKKGDWIIITSDTH